MGQQGKNLWSSTGLNIGADGNPILSPYVAASFPLSNELIMSGLANGALAGFDEDIWSCGTVTVSAATAVVMDSDWSAAPVAGTTGTIAAGPANSFQNPGTALITCPATSGDGISLYKGGGTNASAPLGVLGANSLWQIDCWFKTAATITNYGVRVGYVVSAQQAADPPTGGSWFEVDTANTSDTGGAATAGTITGGTLYTTGTYTNVPITGGSGSGALATVVVSGGAVTTVTFTTGGKGYKAADTGLSASAANIGGTGSGFSFPMSTITPNWMFRTVAASTSNYIDTGVALVASTWVHVRIFSTSAGTLQYQIGSANGALSAPASIATDVDTTHACEPFMYVIPRTAQASTLEPDRYTYVAVTGRV